MEVGIREAKNSLSRLVAAVREGQEVYLTSRGKRVARLLPAPEPKSKYPNRGRGSMKDVINFFPGWDSPALDKEIEDSFEALRPDND
jgi:prevent-host-death family protein